MRGRVRVGVAKFASCDGCQLTLLDLEDELLPLLDQFEIVEFPEASSVRSPGPYDLLLVEGAISTPEQAREIVDLRRRARTLVTIGACATAGGIQALRNWRNHDAIRRAIYPHAEWIESLATAVPVRDYVPVDAELRGCPISPAQLRELLVATVIGRRPQLADDPVCVECKRRGSVCVLAANGTPCLGPVTLAGCGAICPDFGRGCYGCFGPRDGGNVGSLAARLGADRPPDEIARLFAGFTGWAEPFRTTAAPAGRAFDQTTATDDVRD